MNARVSIGAVLLVGGLCLLFSVSATVTYLPSLMNQAAVLKSDDAVNISARAALVVDISSRNVLLEKNADEMYPIASLTKLFTAYAAERSDAIDSPALIVWQDYATEGDAGGLWLGETYTVRELLFPLLLSSSNDAAAAIVRTLGSQTVGDTLDGLYTDAGLAHTHIADASGLSDSNRSTARDLEVLIVYLSTHDSYVLDITRLDSYVGKYRGLLNNNPGKQLDGFDGGKHGYTPAAGRTFAGFFKTDGHEYTVILLGSDDLTSDLSYVVERLP